MFLIIQYQGVTALYPVTHQIRHFMGALCSTNNDPQNSLYIQKTTRPGNKFVVSSAPYIKRKFTLPCNINAVN